MDGDNFFPHLSLPPQPVQVRQAVNSSQLQLYDELRCKWVAGTPEEWVRQNFVSWLIHARGYPKSHMANEIGLRVNRTLKRVDTVVFSNELRPWMLIEYKSPDVTLSQRAFSQVARYNLVAYARYIAVFNGLQLYCARCDGKHYTYMTDMPDYMDGSAR